MTAQGPYGTACAPRFLKRYTVVTYDRRGLSRSTLHDPDESPTIQRHSDDAHRLLSELTTEPACVFGTSLGALIALDLVARHPEQIRTLAAHEAPLHHLLPNSQQAEVRRIHQVIE